MSKTRKPREGDTIKVKDHWTETELVGTVDWVGSSQFALETEQGRFLVPFNGDWKHGEEE